MAETFQATKLDKHLRKTAAEIMALRYSGKHLLIVDGGKLAESGRILLSNAHVLYNSMEDLCKTFDIDVRVYFPKNKRKET